MKLSPAQIQEILAEDDAVPSVVLAAKYGTSYNTVWKLRKDAKKGPALELPREKKQKKPRQKVTKKHVIASEEEEEDLLEITFQFTEAQLDTLWSKMSYKDKFETYYAFLMQQSSDA